MANGVFCIEVNQLGEFAMIAGDSETLEFSYFYKDGTPLDLSSSTARWRLCYVGQPDVAVLDLPGEIFGGNNFVVKLSISNTENLSGKFIQQPVLVDYKGDEYVYQQGVITIIPKIRAGK